MARAKKTSSGRTRKAFEVWPSVPRPWGSAWRDHGRVARDTLAYVTARLGTTVWVWLMVGIALSLPAALYLLELNLARAAGGWSGSSGISVYFVPEIGPEHLEAAVERLRRAPDVEEVRVVTPEESLIEFRRLTGVAEALALVEDNPLPASARASVSSNADVERLDRLSLELAGFEGVDDVVLERTWFQRLAAIREIVKRLSWALAGVLGLGTVLIASAAVRLAIEARLEELRILVLVGAGSRFIRRPFVYLGVVYGAGGGLIAAMLIAGLLSAVEGPLGRLFASYGADLELLGFDPMFNMVLLVSGVVLGVLGAVFSSNQRVRRLV